jgi:hypothetical protein
VSTEAKRAGILASEMVASNTVTASAKREIPAGGVEQQKQSSSGDQSSGKGRSSMYQSAAKKNQESDAKRQERPQDGDKVHFIAATEGQNSLHEPARQNGEKQGKENDANSGKQTGEKFEDAGPLALLKHWG